MEKNSSSKEVVEPEKEAQAEVEEEEEEFVLLDLDGIADHIPVPENAPYVLSVISRAHLFYLRKP